MLQSSIVGDTVMQVFFEEVSREMASKLNPIKLDHTPIALLKMLPAFQKVTDSKKNMY